MPDDRGRLRQRFAAAVRIAAPLPKSPDAAQRDFTRRLRYLTLGLLVIGGLVAAAVTLGACSHDGFDRNEAVQRVVDEGGGRVTEEQADCYVDRVLDEIGKAPLRPGATIPPEQIARMTTIRVDCIGVANIGADSPDQGTVVLPGGWAARPQEEGRRCRSRCPVGPVRSRFRPSLRRLVRSGRAGYRLRGLRGDLRTAHA